MPTLISVLNQVDKKTFESPPVFSDEERSAFLRSSEWAHGIPETLRTSSNKVDFFLQLGYFRSANRFFNAKKFHQHDVRFAAKALGVPENEIHLEHYSGTTYERHQSIILQHPGFRKFDQKAKRMAEKEAEALSRKL